LSASTGERDVADGVGSALVAKLDDEDGDLLLPPGSLLQEVRATATARVIMMPHEVGRVRAAMALSWSGSYS
jgi:hypothetical protein